MENYHGIRKIGRGSYGEVWLVRNKRDKKQHVLKQINLQNASKRELRAANLEVQLLATLRHPNIVSYHDSFESNDGFLYIVMGYCEGGDLYGKIKEQRGVNFSESQIVEWFIQICMAIQYLHERNILHRDLKTQNIFLTKSKIVKVGDLGIAKVLDGETAMATTLIGTPYYMSPELFCNRPYNYKSDVWALGCCIYELATLRHAFNARDMNSLMYKIIRGKLPSMPTIYSSELLDLIRGMLNHNPDKRPSVSRILRHPYIKKNISMFLEGTRLRQKSSTNGNVTQLQMKEPPASSLKTNRTNNRPAIDSPRQHHQQSAPIQQCSAQPGSPIRENSGGSSNHGPGTESKPGTPDLSVQGKRLSPDREVVVGRSCGPSTPHGKGRSAVTDTSDIPGNNSPKPSPRQEKARREKESKMISGAKTETGAKLEGDDRREDNSQNDDNLSLHGVELCIDGQEIKLGDRPSPSHSAGGTQSSPKGSPERANGLRAQKLKRSDGTRSSREIGETLQKESEGMSSFEEDKSESSAASVSESPRLATSNKENELVSADLDGQTTNSSQHLQESSDNRPRVRRRRKLYGVQEMPHFITQPIPVANPRLLPPVPHSTEQQAITALPNIDSSQNPRRPNSVARQRRREKLSQEREMTEATEAAASQILPAASKINCDHDMVSLIDLLNTTLKNDQESPPASVIVSPRSDQQSESTNQKLFHENENEAGEHLPLRCSSRLEQRFKILESDCQKGLGDELLSQAMAVINDKSIKEMQEALQTLIGKDKCNEFIGMLWQLKLCKESLNRDDL